MSSVVVVVGKKGVPRRRQHTPTRQTHKQVKANESLLGKESGSVGMTKKNRHVHNGQGACDIYDKERERDEMR